MTNEGFLYLYRCIKDSWQWARPLWRAAWMWLLVDARYSDGNGLKRGQVRGSITFFAKAWGMSENQVRYFLRACEKHGDICWDKGTGGKSYCGNHTVSPTVNHTVSPTVNHTVLSVITLLKYEHYQSLRSGSHTVSPTVSHTPFNSVIHTNQKEGEKVKIEGKEQEPPSAEKPRRNRLSKSEQLEQIREEMTDLQSLFPYLDVPAEFLAWKDYMLANGKTYKDYKAGFRTWLRADWKKPKTKEGELSLFERMEKRRAENETH